MKKLFLFYLLAVVLFAGQVVSGWAGDEGVLAENGDAVVTDARQKENSDPEQKVQLGVKQYVDCRAVYAETGECPKVMCDLVGQEDQGTKESKFFCRPVPCLQIDAVSCPLDRCQVLEGCGGIPRCFFPFTPMGEGECGPIAYMGQDVECCDGMIKRCGIEFFDGSCDMTSMYSAGGVSICIPCGNGVCNQFENRCNCPEDCL